MNQTAPNLLALVGRFKELGNFDHTDMDEINRIGNEYGVEPLEAAKAFFVAREQASLWESELLDGGTGEVADNTPLYGESSIYSTLFDKQKK